MEGLTRAATLRFTGGKGFTAHLSPHRRVDIRQEIVLKEVPPAHILCRWADEGENSHDTPYINVDEYRYRNSAGRLRYGQNRQPGKRSHGRQNAARCQDYDAGTRDIERRLSRQ